MGRGGAVGSGPFVSGQVRTVVERMLTYGSGLGSGPGWGGSLDSA